MNGGGGAADGAHELRGALNGLSLQLEVMALAFERGDRALHERAAAAAREALARLTEALERTGRTAHAPEAESPR